MDLRKRIGVSVYLYDCIRIDSVYHTVGALTDDFASVNRNSSVGLLDIDHFREARHIENLVYFRSHINDLKIRHLFSKP